MLYLDQTESKARQNFKSYFCCRRSQIWQRTMQSGHLSSCRLISPLADGRKSYMHPLHGRASLLAGCLPITNFPVHRYKRGGAPTTNLPFCFFNFSTREKGEKSPRGACLHPIAPGDGPRFQWACRKS
jgi:hypothetical protein